MAEEKQQPIKLQFGDWKPDLPANDNPGAINVKNAIPEAASYRHFNSLLPFADALDSMAAGAFWLRTSTGGVFNFAGTTDKLFLFDGEVTYDDVSKPASSYSASIWDFTNFQSRVLATDGATAIQYYDPGVSLTFDDLPGSPPIAAVIGVVRDFVMLGDYIAGSEIEPGGYAWSGFNNTELWAPSLSTQAGRRRSRGSGGRVQRIVSGTRGIGLRQDDIQVITYVGPPNVFQFDDITVLHGASSRRGNAWTSQFIFYHSFDGFKRLHRETLKIDDIGAGVVDNWFIMNCAPTETVNIQASIDRKNKLVYWVFKSSGSSPTFDRILVYNYVFNRWAYAELEVEFISEFASVGYNLDTIGAVLGGNIDSASIPVDSDAYSGGALSLLAFNPSHRASTFDGTPLVAEIDTTEWNIPGRRAYVNGVRPIVESLTNPTVQIAAITRNLITANPTTGTFKNMSVIGQADMRTDARYHRYRVKIAGGFTHATRVEFMPKARGR